MAMRTTSLLAIVLVAVVMATAGVAVIRRWQSSGQVVRKGSVIEVAAGGDLQNALEQARPGDTIILQAGAAYVGPFTLPVKTGDQFITIQSSKLAELPEGVRVSPSQSALFAKIQSAEKASPIVKTDPKAHHYKFAGIEFSTTDEKVAVRDLIRFGANEQTTLDSVPHHLVIDRSYIHGFPAQDLQRGIALNSAETSITNSYISEIHGRGYDTQAICGWNGPGPFKIVNNFLEGAGENIMFGGADPAIPNLVPSDIEIRDNHFFKPMSWKADDPSYGGKHWTVKNLFELKNARRVTIDRNIFENHWVDAQPGPAILFTVRNDGGRAPWATIEDVTFTNNIVKNAPTGLNLLGTDDLKPSQRAKRIKISNNLLIGLSAAFLWMSGYHDVTITNNTHIQSGNIMTLHGDVSPGFVYQNNVTIRAPKGYGVKGDASGEGTVALKLFTPDSKFSNNVIVGANSSLYPGNNFYPSSAAEVGFMGYENGDFRISPKSKYKDLGCNFDLLPKLSR